MPTITHGGWRPSKTRFLDIIDDPRIAALVHLQNLVTVETTNFWHSRKALNLHLPVTTDSISSPMGLGSDSEPVSVELFGQKTYLADSMQFMLEYACRFAPNGAWYLMPSFRGEDVDETHLNQFFHSEAEIVGGLDQVIRVVEDYLRHLALAVVDNATSEVLDRAGDLEHVQRMASTSRFPRMTFDEAAEALGHDPLSVRQEKGWRTLTRTGERRLLNEVSPILWVTHFDHLAVPFYQAYGTESASKALNADLLFGPGEIIGCGERHEDKVGALAALKHHEVPAGPYKWYLDMKEHKPMRTSGFGLGVERWLMWVLNENDIRELQLAPRLNGVPIQP